MSIWTCGMLSGASNCGASGCDLTLQIVPQRACGKPPACMGFRCGDRQRRNLIELRESIATPLADSHWNLDLAARI